MDSEAAVDALQALAHGHRLRVFRILVRWGELGLSAGDLAGALGIAPSSLSFHLARLQRAGLVRTRRDGRRVSYSVDVAGTRELLAFLTDDCCHGHPALCLEPRSTPGGDGAEENAAMTDDQRVYNVLFLCTGNSARSIIAECILNRIGGRRFRGLSAGSHPKGEVHPFALRLLRNLDHDVSGLRSKSWNEFARADAPRLDFVFTVCDAAAAESCPVWPGQPVSAHWGLPDPAAVRGTDAVIAAAFADTYRMLEIRLGIFVNLPMHSLDALSLQRTLDEIGQRTSSPAPEDVRAPA